MATSELTRELYDQVMVPNYNPPGVIPVRGEGSRVWDQQGREYIDLAGGIAVTCLGHAHPRLVNALTEQANKIWHVANVLATEPALKLARRLTELTFAERVFFANSGAEANEAALKLVRRHAFNRGETERTEIIAFEQAFHGRTLFTVTAGGQAKYREGFGPVPGDVRHLPFNDIEALEAAVSERTCAVVLEPIQGEGGIVPADPEFVAAARRLCDERGALLVFDEVQTGVGRTGDLYAYMGLGVAPDVLTTAKALGGGIPVSAMLTRASIAETFQPGTHGSTYGGNPLACAVAAEVLDIVSDPAVLAGVRQRSERLQAALAELGERYGCFEMVRGRGLLLGGVLAESWRGKARDILRAGLDEGLLSLVAGPDVVRLAPSLIIPEADLEEGITRLDRAIARLAAA
ncbi:acetylornithine/succinyldiaminopimelate transaminase [Arhodomonas sp. AD133]|uniref:acetylornithine/succinyldiaminopimelate transaminase n=1 Tax=Arhodomonas sp. AD133 TaxID=3415009 RepID=UPI003EBA9A9A